MLLKHARHDLVWLNKLYLANLLPDWKYPFTVTHQGQTLDGHLKIACCLDSGKSLFSRKSFIVPLQEIIQHEPAISFANILSTFNFEHLLPIINKLEVYNVITKVYGSFSWQYLTGNQYISPSSDLDLLFYISNTNNLVKIHSLLIQLQELLPYKLDGELVLPEGKFVAWLEWFNYDKKVLVKTTNKIMLLNKSEVINC